MARLRPADAVFKPRRVDRALYVQLGVGTAVAASAGLFAEGYAHLAVAQSGPLFILLGGVVAATAYGGRIAGATAATMSVALALLLREDFAPGVSMGDFVLISIAFIGACLLATTVYDGVSNAYRHAAAAHEEAARAGDELRMHLRRREEFLGLLSHEMRTPMTQILGNARALDRRLETFSPEEVKTAVRDLCDQSERLFAMLENMLLLSRLERGARVEGEPVLVQRVVNSTVETFRDERPGREVRTHIRPGVEPVLGQPGYIAQLVTNLLSNADKYSPADRPIDIVVNRTPEWVTIEVMDHGPGVSSEEAELIYEPYHRLTRTSETSPGLGLGLTVCRRVAESMGGHIDALPREGGGSVFRVSLPPMEMPQE